MYFQLMLQI